jgi:hypothetical protein
MNSRERQINRFVSAVRFAGRAKVLRCPRKQGPWVMPSAGKAECMRGAYARSRGLRSACSNEHQDTRERRRYGIAGPYSIAAILGSRMLRSDRFISTCASWEDFWERAKKLSTTEKGAAFERLTQLYLQATPEYRTELEHVWTLREVPLPLANCSTFPCWMKVSIS